MLVEAHEVAQMVLGFSLEPLVEPVAFDGAISDAVFLSGEQLVLLHRQEARLGALLHDLLVHVC